MYIRLNVQKIVYFVWHDHLVTLPYMYRYIHAHVHVHVPVIILHTMYIVYEHYTGRNQNSTSSIFQPIRICNSRTQQWSSFLTQKNEITGRVTCSRRLASSGNFRLF